MRNNHSLYKPGFAEDPIPQPLSWVENWGPIFIIALGVVILIPSIWRLL